MKIAGSSVALTSSHFFRQEMVKEESLRTWVGQERPVSAPPAQSAVLHPTKGEDQVAISKEAFIRQLQSGASPPEKEDGRDNEMAEDPRLRTMRLILEAITGKKIRSVQANNFERGNAAGLPSSLPGFSGPVGTNRAGAPVRSGWGLEYEFSETRSEQEELIFNAGGKVVTQDGQEIDFQLRFTMSRQMIESNKISLRAGDALLVDPLVVNFAGPAASLSDLKFNFDLNLDGKLEQVSSLGTGSGFLALDRNNDGVINNGGELFGPQTGSGFAELAKYDTDGNGWLDENDPIYEKLVIWFKNASGNDYLASLAQQQVGALSLTTAATPFLLNGAGEVLLGKLNHSGVFLQENGTAGIVQEIDLAI